MILTKGKEMVLTPTYYVFKMYKVHQDATYLPFEISCQQVSVRDKRTLPLISATASKNKDGKIHISLSNVDVDNEAGSYCKFFREYRLQKRQEKCSPLHR